MTSPFNYDHDMAADTPANDLGRTHTHMQADV